MPDKDYSHTIGDARKAQQAKDVALNHDELAAHLDVDFTGPNVVLGED